jgi:hypothetical protein
MHKRRSKLKKGGEVISPRLKGAKQFLWVYK